MAWTPRPSDSLLLLFGPQFLSFGDKELCRVQEQILRIPNHDWITTIITDLPRHWNSVLDALPQLKSVCEKTAVDDLANWFPDGSFKATKFPLPNVLLTPLVVIAQLSQYYEYSEAENGARESDVASRVQSQRSLEVTGFCTGMLSALVVALSQGHDAFVKNAATAVRLAMLIGAVVDAQDVSRGAPNEARSITAMWTSPLERKDVEKVLDKFEDVSLPLVKLIVLGDFFSNMRLRLIYQWCLMSGVLL